MQFDMTAKNVGLNSTNAELRGFIDQNLSPTKGNVSFVAFPVSSTNSPTKILPKTLGPINVNVGPQMIISTPQRLTSSGSVLIGSPYTPAPAMVTQTHIAEATGWVPGDRKRAREFIDSDFSESKRSKKGDKNGKGLRHFSMKVCEKVQRKGTTSYNEVADELVSEFTNSNNHLAADSLSSSDGKESACNAGDADLIPGEGTGNPLQHSCLENCINRGAYWATVHGVTKNWT